MPSLQVYSSIEQTQRPAVLENRKNDSRTKNFVTRNISALNRKIGSPRTICSHPELVRHLFTPLYHDSGMLSLRLRYDNGNDERGHGRLSMRRQP